MSMTDKPKGNWVLVKYEGTMPIYNTVSTGDWKQWTRFDQKGVATWQEVARGTLSEMEALARLMPDPKSLSFD